MNERVKLAFYCTVLGLPPAMENQYDNDGPHTTPTLGSENLRSQKITNTINVL